jgi:hypothetical protein
MISRRTKIALLAAALAANASLAAAEIVQATQQVAPAAITNPLAPLSLDRLTATRDRPLFVPGRRRPAPPAPPTIAAAPPPPAPIEPPKFVLCGTLVDDGGAWAFIRSDPAGKVVRVRVGDDVGGWRITEIAARAVVIAHDDRSVTVLMFQSLHSGTTQIARVHQSDRVFEVNSRGILRSHHISRND